MNRSLNIDNESQWEDLVSGLLIEDGTHSASGTLSELQNSWGGGVPRDPSLEARNPSGAPSGSRAPEAPGARGPGYLNVAHERPDFSASSSSGPSSPSFMARQRSNEAAFAAFAQPLNHQYSQRSPPRHGQFQDSAALASTRPRPAPEAGDLETDNLQFTYQCDDGYTSRTLFVRNISSNTEDSELIDLFGSYGEIRDMYSACKYRGFVMISFFDERSAIAAMDCLQGKSLRRRKMDIHFSIPKENQTDAGMLLLFNLDQTTPNTVIAHLFQAFGDIKSMKSLHIKTQQMHQAERETVRMIEYYDERHASAALNALNNTELWNRRIRIQFGRVGRTESIHKQQRGSSQRSSLQTFGDPIRSDGGQQVRHIAVEPDYGACGLHSDQAFAPGVSSQDFGAAPVVGQPRGAQTLGHQVAGHSRGYGGDEDPGSSSQGAPAFGHYGQGQGSHHLGNRGTYGNFHGAPHQHQHQYHQRHPHHGDPRLQKRGGESERAHSGGQSKSKKSHFSLNLQSIAQGRDKKTTVMIRNIPNKYTQKMLLAEIDTDLKGKYNFFYLPIDFKNKCNVGYAFLNLTDPLWILKLYEKFNGKRWSHFNSGKICEITYARLQGKDALAEHFRHSTLMQVEESCQPLLLNENQEVEEIFAYAQGKASAAAHQHQHQPSSHHQHHYRRGGYQHRHHHHQHQHHQQGSRRHQSPRGTQAEDSHDIEDSIDIQGSSGEGSSPPYLTVSASD